MRGWRHNEMNEGDNQDDQTAERETGRENNGANKNIFPAKITKTRQEKHSHISYDCASR